MCSNENGVSVSECCCYPPVLAFDFEHIRWAFRIRCFAINKGLMVKPSQRHKVQKYGGDSHQTLPKPESTARASPAVESFEAITNVLARAPL